jgi:hypothetical protein
MRQITRQLELLTLIAQRQGFVVNMDTIKNVARYHNLEAPCWFTEHQLSAESGYDTYFAESREDLERRPYLWGNEELEPCSKCYPQRHR